MLMRAELDYFIIRLLLHYIILHCALYMYYTTYDTCATYEITVIEKNNIFTK